MYNMPSQLGKSLHSLSHSRHVSHKLKGMAFLQILNVVKSVVILEEVKRERESDLRVWLNGLNLNCKLCSEEFVSRRLFRIRIQKFLKCLLYIIFFCQCRLESHEEGTLATGWKTVTKIFNLNIYNNI